MSARLIGVVDLITLGAGVLEGFWDCDPGNENWKAYIEVKFRATNTKRMIQQQY